MKNQTKIKRMLIFFIVALSVSGLTALPLKWELSYGLSLLYEWGIDGPLMDWITKVDRGIRVSYSEAPFIAYGTDWLAFAHLVLAIAFIGPLKDPVKNKWVIQFGMIACVLIIPMALIFGPVRNIPFWWQIVDCSFGVFGFICLYYCYRLINRIELTQLFTNPIQPAI